MQNVTLPPKPGYVEVEVAGKRTYCNVNTGLTIEEENMLAEIPAAPTEAEQLRADLDYLAAMTGVTL